MCTPSYYNYNANVSDKLYSLRTKIFHKNKVAKFC